MCERWESFFDLPLFLGTRAYCVEEVEATWFAEGGNGADCAEGAKGCWFRVGVVFCAPVEFVCKGCAADALLAGATLLAAFGVAY